MTLRMKKEPTEPGLGTKKAPEDMEGVKKAALDEQNCSQEKNRSWEEAMKIEQIQVRQKISSQQKRSTGGDRATGEFRTKGIAGGSTAPGTRRRVDCFADGVGRALK